MSIKTIISETANGPKPFEDIHVEFRNASMLNDVIVRIQLKDGSGIEAQVHLTDLQRALRAFEPD